MPHHAIKLRKDHQRVNHDDKFAKCWSKLGPERESLPRKGTFLVNCLILLWPNYCTPSYYISKFSENESWNIIARDKSLHNVGPNWVQVAHMC